MATVNLGRIGMVARGVYSATQTYNRLDVVAYNSAAYCALKTVTGVAPSDDGSNWIPMVNSTGIDHVSINSSGKLIVYLTDGTSHDAGKAKGTDGKDGKDADPISAALITSTLGYTPANNADITTINQNISTNATQINSIKTEIADLPRVTREVEALIKMGKGVLYKFETDTAASSTKIVPTGALLMSVNRIAGNTIIYYQLHANTNMIDETNINKPSSITVTYGTPGAHIVRGTTSATYISQAFPSGASLTIGHKYIMLLNYTASNANTTLALSMRGVTGNSQSITADTVFTATAQNYNSRITISNWDVEDYIDITRWQLIDLTATFGDSPTDAQINWAKTYSASHNTYEDGDENGRTVTAAVTGVSVNNTIYSIPVAIQQLIGYGTSGYYLYRTNSNGWGYHKSDGSTQNVTSKMGDALDCLTVAANNTVKMINDAGMDVDNILQYMVKLSEVTA